MTQKRVGVLTIVRETWPGNDPGKCSTANEFRWLLAASVGVEARKACSNPIAVSAKTSRDATQHTSDVSHSGTHLTQCALSESDCVVIAGDSLEVT